VIVSMTRRALNAAGTVEVSRTAKGPRAGQTAYHAVSGTISTINATVRSFFGLWKPEVQ
jgi:hypothetical protein